MNTAACCRCCSRVTCWTAADNDKFFIDVHGIDDTGTVVVVVVVVVDEVVVGSPKTGNVVVGTGTLFGQ